MSYIEQKKSLKNITIGSVVGTVLALIDWKLFGLKAFAVAPIILVSLTVFAFMRFRNGQSF